MPTTLVGLVIFVTLLAPGFVYTLRSERQAPERQVSIFRETVALVFVSVVCDTVALLLFGTIRLLGPGITPDVGALVRSPAAQGKTHYASFLLWGLALLTIACLLAYAVAGPHALRLARKAPLLRRTMPAQRHLHHLSAWGLLLQRRPGQRIHVRCVLDDGSHVAGWLHSYSRVGTDNADRDLSLIGPLQYRRPGSDTDTDLPGIGAVAISARRMMALYVSYVLS